jgi:hypothetical protein
MGGSEAPLSGVVVTLTGTPDGAAAAITRTATTDAHGRYEFLNLPPGSYTVTQPQPTTLIHDLMDGVTFASNTLTRTVDVDQDEDVTEANFTQVSRQTRFLGARDFFGRPSPDYLDISYDSAGNTIYYSMGAGWSGYSLPKVETLTGGRLRLTATNSAGVEQSAIVRINDAMHIRPFDTTSSTRVVQFLGDPSELGFSSSAGLTAASARVASLAAEEDASSSEAVDALLADETDAADAEEALGDVDEDSIDQLAADNVDETDAGEGEPLSATRQLVERQLSRLSSRASRNGSSQLTRLQSRLDRVLAKAESTLADSGSLSDGLGSAGSNGIASEDVQQRLDEILDRARARRRSISDSGEVSDRLASLRNQASSFADAVAAAAQDRDIDSYRAAVDDFFASMDSELSHRLSRLGRRR